MSSKLFDSASRYVIYSQFPLTKVSFMESKPFPLFFQPKGRFSLSALSAWYACYINQKLTRSAAKANPCITMLLISSIKKEYF